MSSPHTSRKPRRRRKLDDFSGSIQGSSTVDATGATKGPAFPLVAFLWPAKGSVSAWIALPCILMVVGLFRWATGYWGYSGGCWTAYNSIRSLTICVPRIPETTNAWRL